MPTKSRVRAKTLKSKPANAFGVYDSTPFSVVDINQADKSELIRYLGVKSTIADRIIALRKKKPIQNIEELTFFRNVPPKTRKRIKRKVVVATDAYIYILDVVATDAYIFSNKPFTLQIIFANPSKVPAAVISVNVLWAGKSFTVEKELTSEEIQRGHADIEFDQQRTLPVGQVEFLIALYRLDGAQASFRKTFYVLPSNPLSLSLSPAGATVTGTWSSRGAYQTPTNSFLTECTITIANGSNASVSIDRPVNWKFWDGGVGGTLVESGSFDWPNSITVSSYGIWKGNVWFSSPNGSGIYNRYRGKEDMTIEIQMTSAEGRRITGTITCRVMLAYGVNIIKVGDFEYQEGVDLYDAVDVTRQIYERRNITFRGVLRWIIPDADAGSYRIINSEGEVYDLFRDWSVPNNYIDVFVCQDFATGSFDGLSGGVPGPSSKGGNRDGVAVDKTGSSSSGVKRLNVNYLGMLIGHEVGHYLGLPHISEAGNLMLSNSGTNDTKLNYDQYRTMLPHGFLVLI
jgi:hypothetical protein